jgi:hypothetical protein
MKMFIRKELSPEEIRAISKTVRRNIIFIEKIISKRKTYIYVEFLDKNRNKYVRVYEEKIKVSSLIFSNKLDLNGKQIKSDIGETKERRNVLNYLGLN